MDRVLRLGVLVGVWIASILAMNSSISWAAEKASTTAPQRQGSATNADDTAAGIELQGELPAPVPQRSGAQAPPKVEPIHSHSSRREVNANRPRLGVNVNAHNAFINRVYAGSGAAIAGVMPGGRVIAVDDTTVLTTADLKRLVAARTSNDTVTLKVLYPSSDGQPSDDRKRGTVKTFRVSLAPLEAPVEELPPPRPAK